LALDLRGGSVIYLEPNEMSPPIREELLYDHIHLDRLAKQGLVQRIDAKMGEVLEYEKKMAARQQPAAPATAAAYKPEVKETVSRDVAETEDSKPRLRTKDVSPKTDR
jgi:hypothetical protein